MLLQFAMGINVKKGKDMFRGHFTKWNLLPVHGWIQVLCFRDRSHVGSEKKKPERLWGRCSYPRHFRRNKPSPHSTDKITK